MSDWNFKREEQQFEIIPEGKHRIRIASAEKVVSRNGRDMISLRFDVSGYSGSLFNNIVFLEDRPEITNRILTQFFDSFKDIPEGDVNNLRNWIGKVGACMVKHEEYNGKTQARVSYFIDKKQQADLPAWRDSSGKEVDPYGFVEVDDDVEDLF